MREDVKKRSSLDREEERERNEGRDCERRRQLSDVDTELNHFPQY